MVKLEDITALNRRDEFISAQNDIIKDLRRQIVDGFDSLDYHAMEKLIGAVVYRRKLIGLAKSGKFNFLA